MNEKGWNGEVHTEKKVVKESFGTKLGRFAGQVGSAVFLLSLVACFAAACISLTARFIIWLF